MGGNQKIFIAMLVVSIALHAAALAWVSTPEQDVLQPELGVLLTVVVPEEAPVPPQTVEEPEPVKRVEDVVPEEPAPQTEPVVPVEIADTSHLLDDIVPVISQQTREALETETATSVEPAHNPQAVFDYEQLLSVCLARQKRYPPLALRRHLEGECVLRIVLHRSGEVRRAELTGSSGHSILDREALAMVERANPFPEAPDDLAGDEHTYVIPISFRIDD